MSTCHNPFKLPEEWTKENPWDIINCFKCLNAYKVPSHVYEIWMAMEYGCPWCIIMNGEEE